MQDLEEPFVVLQRSCLLSGRFGPRPPLSRRSSAQATAELPAFTLTLAQLNRTWYTRDREIHCSLEA